ncbi:hypothetical protein NL676_029304 [Syzygium grande]|nr:hypothetical protein NL676_029304 [Syzygium grande]
MDWLMALKERHYPTLQRGCFLLIAMGRSGIAASCPCAFGRIFAQCLCPCYFRVVCGHSRGGGGVGPQIGLISVVIGWRFEVDPNPRLPIGWTSPRRIPRGPSALDLLPIFRSHAK